MKNIEVRLTIITEVHKRPILWDSRTEDYHKNMVRKTDAWREISDALTEQSGFKLTVVEAKNMWKNLRDTFARQLRPEKMGWDGNSALKKPWIYFEHMLFLRDVVQFANDTPGKKLAIKAEADEDDGSEALEARANSDINDADDDGDDEEDDEQTASTTSEAPSAPESTSDSIVSHRKRRRLTNQKRDRGEKRGKTESPDKEMLVTNSKTDIHESNANPLDALLSSFNATSTSNGFVTSPPQPPPSIDRFDAFGCFVASTLRGKSDEDYKAAVLQITSLLMGVD